METSKSGVNTTPGIVSPPVPPPRQDVKEAKGVLRANSFTKENHPPVATKVETQNQVIPQTQRKANNPDLLKQSTSKPEPPPRPPPSLPPLPFPKISPRKELPPTGQDVKESKNETQVKKNTPTQSPPPSPRGVVAKQVGPKQATGSSENVNTNQTAVKNKDTPPQRSLPPSPRGVVAKQDGPKQASGTNANVSTNQKPVRNKDMPPQRPPPSPPGTEKPGRPQPSLTKEVTESKNETNVRDPRLDRPPPTRTPPKFTEAPAATEKKNVTQWVRSRSPTAEKASLVASNARIATSASAARTSTQISVTQTDSGQVNESEQKMVRLLKEAAKEFLASEETFNKKLHQGLGLLESDEFLQNEFSSEIANLKEMIKASDDFFGEINQAIDKDGNIDAEKLNILINSPKFSNIMSNISKFTNLFDQIIKKCSSDNKIFKEGAAKFEEQYTLTLGAFFIEPVQRGPRYKLLFAEMLKHIPDDNPQHAQVKEALIVVEAHLKEINESKRSTEKIQELQKTLGALKSGQRIDVDGEKLIVKRKGITKNTRETINRYAAIMIIGKIQQAVDLKAEKTTISTSLETLKELLEQSHIDDEYVNEKLLKLNESFDILK